MIKFERLPVDIMARIELLKQVLLDDENLLFAYLFGGLAVKAPKPLSDVDIAVYLRSPDDVAEYKLLLFDKISAVLGTSEIDLVILNTAPVSIAGRVLQNKRLLVDREPFRRHAYESVILREFFDFKIREDAFFAGRFGVGR